MVVGGEDSSSKERRQDGTQDSLPYPTMRFPTTHSYLN